MKHFLGLVSLFVLTVSCVSRSPQRNTASLSFGQSERMTVFETNKKTVSNLQQKLSQTASLQQVGPDGSVVFYFLSRDNKNKGLNLNIIKCKKHTVIKEGLGCEKEKDSLQISIPYVPALASMKTFFGVYLDTKNVNISIEEKYKNLNEFIAAHGIEMADALDIKRMKADKERYKIINFITSEFDQYLKSEELNTVRYENEGVEKSLLLNIFRGFLSLQASSAAKVQEFKGPKLYVNTTRRVKVGTFEKWSKWSYEDYADVEEEVTFDIEGFKYLNKGFVRELRRLASIGFLGLSCRNLKREDLPEKNVKFLKSYEAACVGKYQSNIHISKIFPEIYSLEKNLYDQTLTYMFESLFPGKTFVGSRVLSKKQIAKLSRKQSSNDLMQLRISDKKDFEEEAYIYTPLGHLRDIYLYKIVDKQ